MRKIIAGFPAILFLAAANFILTALFTYLALYWLFPLLCSLIPALNTHYAEMSDERFYLVYQNIRAVCAILALYPAAVVFRFLLPRKKAFQATLRANPTVSDSRAAYRHGAFKADCIAATILLVLWLVLFLIAPGSGILRLFPFAEVLLIRGHVLGLLISCLLIPPALLWGMYSAQNVWRAEFHLGL